ncbi:MFS transporter [Mesorhizobium sp. BAC0120]|uniref:MFS transporter n=1 Tax=Mesorhizobium sp. BAC0120 TaxID=3090670 RepID=UPI00298C9AAE|nr:MFS transporter [Mesorhizobium sp. BAC0120]MDW6025005.1 MFS transporter [Mesorhizobium sp. BAC0120]
MTDTTVTADPARPSAAAQGTVMAIILAVSFGHMVNDIMQSMLPAIYPMLKDGFHLDFWQIGLLTMAFQVTASLLQPGIGMYTDKRPLPYSLPVGMASSLIGLVVLGFAPSYEMLVVGSMLIGFGSAIFHPESSRVARLASGGRFGLAQSLFQLGGNFGQAVGPLLAAFIVVPFGQVSVSWFTALALVGIVVLWQVGGWYSAHLRERAQRKAAASTSPTLPRRTVLIALTVLTVLTFSKNIYTACLSSYYTFYVIHKFGVTVQHSQLMLFLFLGASAAGLVLGGLFGDRFGPKAVIWFSILGVLPFTLALPYADLVWSNILVILIGLILSSAFSAIVVLAQELVPGRVGLVAGIFFGLAFGFGGIGAALLGVIADEKGIDYVFWLCSFLPLFGLLTIFLPDMKTAKAR